MIFASFAELPGSEHPLMKKSKGAQEKFAPNERWGVFFYAGYVFAEPLVGVLKRSGRDLSVENFVRATESVKDFHGIGPRVSFGPNARQGCRSMFLARCERGGIQVPISDWLYSDIDLDNVLEKIER